MTVDDLKAHFGAVKDNELTKTVLGVTRGTISKWRSKGIPENTQARIQVLTSGKLKANLTKPIIRIEP